MTTFKPVCHLRVDGVDLAKDSDTYWGYGWDDVSNFAMVHSNDKSKYKSYICCVAMAKDGRNLGIYCNADYKGTRGRSAIGIMPDGRILLYGCCTAKRR